VPRETDSPRDPGVKLTAAWFGTWRHVLNDRPTRYRGGHIPDWNSAQGLSSWVAKMSVTVDDEIDGMAVDNPAKLAIP